MDDLSIRQQDETQLDQSPFGEEVTQQQQAAADEASAPYVGRWNQLVTETNWEKGRIIGQWRDDLQETSAPATVYSDEAWARQVGGITGQHVGRLRRVFQRFGDSYEKYGELFWSHFQAAIDWDDAEMWLEGASQSKWSVSQMRKARWETLGSVPELKPKDEDIIASEVDEDFEPALNQEPGGATSGPVHEGPDFGDEEGRSSDDGAAIYADPEQDGTIDFVRPFENLAELPDDLNDAFDGFKIAILRHKAEKWNEISRDDVLASLDALKELCLAPTSDDPSF